MKVLRDVNRGIEREEHDKIWWLSADQAKSKLQYHSLVTTKTTKVKMERHSPIFPVSV